MMAKIMKYTDCYYI